jgi:hypothetical protein
MQSPVAVAMRDMHDRGLRQNFVTLVEEEATVLTRAWAVYEDFYAVVLGMEIILTTMEGPLGSPKVPLERYESVKKTVQEFDVDKMEAVGLSAMWVVSGCMLLVGVIMVTVLTDAHKGAANELAEQASRSLNTPLSMLLARSQLLASHGNVIGSTSPWSQLAKPMEEVFAMHAPNTASGLHSLYFGGADGSYLAVRRVGGAPRGVCLFERNATTNGCVWARDVYGKPCNGTAGVIPNVCHYDPRYTATDSWET